MSITRESWAWFECRWNFLSLDCHGAVMSTNQVERDRKVIIYEWPNCIKVKCYNVRMCWSTSVYIYAFGYWSGLNGEDVEQALSMIRKLQGANSAR